MAGRQKASFVSFGAGKTKLISSTTSPIYRTMIPVFKNPLPGIETNYFNKLLRLWQSQPYAAESEENPAQLLQNNPALQQILNTSPCIFWTLDIRTRQYSFVSKNVEPILGRSPNEFQTGGIAYTKSLIHPDDAPHLGG